MESIINFLAALFSQMIITVIETLAHNWIVLLLSILTAVMLKTYVNTDKLSKFLLGKTKVSILVSVLVGAFTPFCACGTTAVIIGMLTTTLPWGPIMAFLTSSPLMSPDGFIMISGLINLRFAIVLTIASLVIGSASGFITHFIESKTGYLKNQTRYTAKVMENTCSCSSGTDLGTQTCGAAVLTDTCGCSAAPEIESIANKSVINQSPKLKLRELANNFVELGLKQILLYFSLFTAIGFLVNYFVPDSIISLLFESRNIAAVPLASIIGLPLYLTTESGIPIIQSMLKAGASEAAMMALMITGSATSAWVIAGLSTFMKKRAISLYVLYILLGGIITGYIYDFIILFVI